MQVQGRTGAINKLFTWFKARPWAVGSAVLVLVLAVIVGGFGFGMAQGGVELKRAPPSDAVAGSEEVQGSVEGDAASDDDTGDEAPTQVMVDVGGAVMQPGVVTLAEGSRVADAIAAAGGLAADADTSSLNQAAKVADGQKVSVPRVGEASVAPGSADSSGAIGSAYDSSASGSGLVNINSASAEELDALPGVGPSTAAAIVEDREQNGPFNSVDDLLRVSGIGEKKLERLRSAACV